MAGFDVTTAFSMKDKVVIVTGGGTGIGKVYSQRLAEGGAKVVLADVAADASNKLAEDITAKGGQCISIPTDISDPGIGAPKM